MAHSRMVITVSEAGFIFTKQVSRNGQDWNTISETFSATFQPVYLATYRSFPIHVRLA